MVTKSSMARWTAAAVSVMALGSASPSQAKSRWSSKGELRLEGRVFGNDNNPDTVDQALGLFGRMELYHRHRPFKEKVRLYGRLDSQDFERTVLIVEELWAEAKFWELQLRLGFDLLNWTATEAFHPADIINARNFDSDIENYEKLGEPMIQLSLKAWRGSLTAYFMPVYIEPVFPSPSSRLNFGQPGQPLPASIRLRADGSFTTDDFGPQGALRFTQTTGPIDFGVHLVHHMDRSQPQGVFDPETEETRILFRAVTQVGGTLQAVAGGALLKLETGYRLFADPSDPEQFVGVQDRDHLIVALGFEYGILLSQQSTLTVLAEAQSIFGPDADVRQELQVFQRDALAGFRLELGDAASTELFMTVIVDLEDPSKVFHTSRISTRFLGSWSVNASARLVYGPPLPVLRQGIAVPPDSDYLGLNISRFF